ncbi:MAG: tyrosine--tRNA ligase [Erysipelotrichaceae bacterium]
MNLLDDLQYRGLIKDITDLDGLAERLKKPITLYCGFDPTADSMHVGHLQQMMLLRRYQQAGHKIIVLCGGGTGMIGDPRPTTERTLLTSEQIDENVASLKKQFARFIEFGDNAILLNNYDWLSKFNIIDFLRDFGKYFSVSYMLNKDVVSSRLETGISYTEFSYMILQSMDWLHLYQNYNCELQIGGSDQWGNLTAGSELIRKIVGDKAKTFGVTSALITKSDGSKFGKSESGNIWLDATKTTPYEFYQFWLNVTDGDVINFLKKLTFKTKVEIDELAKLVEIEPHKRAAQVALADEITKFTHGQAGLDSAKRISETLFGGDFTQLNEQELEMALKGMSEYSIYSDYNLVDLLVEANIVSSKREAREFIKNNSISVNGIKINDTDYLVSQKTSLYNRFNIIRRGKKSYTVITYK